jgi:hypothetical protein
VYVREVNQIIHGLLPSRHGGEYGIGGGGHVEEKKFLIMGECDYDVILVDKKFG